MHLNMIITVLAIKIIYKHNIILCTNKLQATVISCLDLYVFLGCYLPVTEICF